MRRNEPVPQLKALWRLAFGDSQEFVDRFFREVYDPRRCRWITVEDTVAAALYWFDGTCRDQKLAYLYAVATHPDYRRRGLCRRLLEDTHRLLAELGYDAALLMPAEEVLRPMYASLGYREGCGFSRFYAEAAQPLPVRQVDAWEYGRLRTALLPQDGSVQEGENLAYLAFYAQCWAGEGFVLAASREEDRLYAMEYLGSKKAAPGLLAALGCKCGEFRTPGRELQGVMYLPLRPGAEAPAYWGLTFD